MSALNRLHLLGFTQDLKGVVFSQRARGKTATYWIPIDETFLAAVEKLERAREEAATGRKGAKGKAKAAARAPAERAKPDRRTEPGIGRSQMTSRLSPSEIQQLLREGRTVRNVVEASKAPQAWVERLLEPVMAERSGVIRLAQLATMSRSRLGKSGLPVEDAVRRNLEERRATPDTIDALDAAWDARASRSGLWRVWVRFDHRGKRRSAEWEFRKNTREINPRNRLAAQLGWWPAPGATPQPETNDELEGSDASDADGGKPARRRKPAKCRPATKTKARRPSRKTKSRAKTAKRSPTRGKRKQKAKPSRRRPARRRS